MDMPSAIMRIADACANAGLVKVQSSKITCIGLVFEPEINGICAMTIDFLAEII